MKERQESVEPGQYPKTLARMENDTFPWLGKRPINQIPLAKTTHFASITDPAKVGEMLLAFDAFNGTSLVLCALKLAPMVFARPDELRTAEWSRIDLDKAEWRYRVSKAGTDHHVPLSTQVVAILTELCALTGAGPYVSPGRYVFPGARSTDRPMSGAASMLRYAAWVMTPALRSLDMVFAPWRGRFCTRSLARCLRSLSIDLHMQCRTV